MSVQFGSIQLEIIKSIGKGSYGEVFLCQDKHGRLLALKAIRRNLMDDRYLNSYKTEVAALKQLQKSGSRESTQTQDQQQLVQQKELQQQQQQQQQNSDSFCRNLEQNENGYMTKKLRKRSSTFDQHACFSLDQNREAIEKHENSNEIIYKEESNVIQYIASIDLFSFTFSKTVNSCHAILMEYAMNGCLGTYIESKKYTRIPINIFRTVARSILIGIAEIHKAGLVHRDIKEDNIVFGEDFKMKLIDLSFAGRPETDICGTGKYISPELVLLESGQQAFPLTNVSVSADERFVRYSKFDSFAAGVVLFRMLTKKFPFTKASRFDHRYQYVFSKQFDEFWKDQPILIDQQDELSPDASLSIIPPSELGIHKPLEMCLSNEIALQEDNSQIADDNRQNIKNDNNVQHSPISCCEFKPRRLHLLTALPLSMNHMSNSRNSENDLNQCLEQQENNQVNEIKEERRLNNLSCQQNCNNTQNQNGIQNLKDLIEKLLAFQPDERISVKEALRHPFFQSDFSDLSSANNYFATSQQIANFFQSLL